MILPGEGELRSEQGHAERHLGGPSGLELHEDGLTLCYDSLDASHPLC